MDRFGDWVPSERLLSFLVKLEDTYSKIVSVEERIGELEKAFVALHTAVTKQPPKELYTVEEFAKIIKNPPMQARLRELGSEPVASTPEELAQLIREDFELWSKVIKETGIKAD